MPDDVVFYANRFEKMRVLILYKTKGHSMWHESDKNRRAL